MRSSPANSKAGQVGETQAGACYPIVGHIDDTATPDLTCGAEITRERGILASSARRLSEFALALSFVVFHRCSQRNTLVIKAKG
jgi:hypothetical protein